MKIYLLIALLGCNVAHAEWYRVNSVSSYNTIKVAKADGEADPITIRIRNLEKIEYIQPKPERVLIGGEEAVSLTKKMLKNQLVWVENLQAEEGAYVADVYPSFEQVITVYKEQRIVNGDNVSESTKGKLKIIYAQMLADMDIGPLLVAGGLQSKKRADETRTEIHKIYLNTLANIRSADPKTPSSTSEGGQKRYAGGFQRALFTADAIIWFRDKGQYLQPTVQEVFVDLLKSFQNDSDATARYTQTRIEEIMKRETAFRELFLDEANFKRGQFSYKCLEWFKERGQYLPDDVQNVFVNWLRVYQQTPGSQGTFMQQRLQWMLDNNKLYQDFL